ncbi:aldolase [Streptomyces sp. NPDC102360]|uniref:aldolase n=1 Tax=Streptomyces sp. NPDC102360 TaxID=3366160 RepID=UPI00382372CF
MASTLRDSKSVLVDRAQRQMSRLFDDVQLTTRQKLALTCRIAFDGGHDSGLAGQISARGQQFGTYYTQRLGLGFDEITETNLLLIDEDLHVLEGEGMPNPANRFHSWIYRARQDVNCVIHTHSLHTAALAMLEVPLVISQMDTTPLYDDCAFLKEWPGIPVGNEEGEIISAALGDKRAILLAHHGQLVTGTTIEEACNLAVLIERAARLQLLAMSAGDIRPLDPELAREAHDWTSTEQRSKANFAYYARRALRNHPDCVSGMVEL